MTIDVYVTCHEHSRVVGQTIAKAIGGEIRSVHAIRAGDCFTFGILRGSEKVIRRKIPSKDTLWFVDHGYIGAGHYGGYYRVCRDALHADISVVEPDFVRLDRLGWEVEDHVSPPNAPVLVSPPSPHSEKFLGLGDWLANTCAEIGKYTDRRIVVTDKIEKPGLQMLRAAHCLVTHQSALAIEAVRLGVPVFITDASHPAREFSAPLSEIEDPYQPDRGERREWAARLASVQFRLPEFKDGLERKFNQCSTP